jgi:hypothetical protein
VELEVGEDVVVMPRMSEDVKVNDRGKMVLELLQAHGMVVMNGLDGAGSGKATCRGVSVVDWIAVGREMKGDCSPLEVEEEWLGGEGGRKDGDHRWVRVDWRATAVDDRGGISEDEGEVRARARTRARVRVRVRVRPRGCAIGGRGERMTMRASGARAML